MTERETIVAGSGPTSIPMFGFLLAVVLLVALWFIVFGGARPAITVNDHTDDAVPTVDLQPPGLPAIA